MASPALPALSSHSIPKATNFLTQVPRSRALSFNWGKRSGLAVGSAACKLRIGSYPPCRRQNLQRVRSFERRTRPPDPFPGLRIQSQQSSSLWDFNAARTAAFVLPLELNFPNKCLLAKRRFDLAVASPSPPIRGILLLSPITHNISSFTVGFRESSDARVPGPPFGPIAQTLNLLCHGARQWYGFRQDC